MPDPQQPAAQPQERKANLPDGRILHFPADTPDSVMVATARRELAKKPSEPSLVDKAKGVAGKAWSAVNTPIVSPKELPFLDPGMMGGQLRTYALRKSGLNWLADLSEDFDEVTHKSISSMTSPFNLALLVGGGALQKIPTLARAIAAGFSLTQAHDAISEFEQAADLYKQGKRREGRKLLMSGTIASFFSGVSATGAIAETPKVEPPKSDWEQFVKGSQFSNTGEQARNSGVIAHAFEDAHDFLGKLPPQDQLEWAYRMDEGKPQATSHEQRIADNARLTLDHLRGEMNKLDPAVLTHYMENYWPRQWEVPGQAQELWNRLKGAQSFAGTSLKGRASFLKPRTLVNEAGDPVSMREAVEQFGMKPVSYNPIDIFTLKVAEMTRFLAGQRILEDLNSQGLKQTYPSPFKVPDGWAKYDPRWAGANQYGPAEAVEQMNRFMEPGLLNNMSSPIRGAYETARKFNAISNQTLVSLSGFHWGLTATSAIVGDIARAMRYGKSGYFKEAMQEVTTHSFIRDLPRLNEFMKGYLEPGVLGPEFEKIMKEAVRGGAKPQQADLYRTDATSAFRKALQDNNPWGTAKNSVPALIDWVSGPLRKWWVPNLKIRAAFRAVEQDLKLLGPNASPTEVQKAVQRSVQSVEDWYGQMDPDNLVISSKYWNRTLADAMGVMFRFVEFSYGTLRGMFGGARDLALLSKGELTPRLAHVIAFPFVVYTLGAVTQKLLTGKEPQDGDTPILDGFKPRTGKLNPDGTPERLDLPTYWRTAVQWSRPVKDLLAYEGEGTLDDLGKAMRGRLSGGVDTIIMVLTNKDFYGREAYDSHIESNPALRPLLKLRDFTRSVIRDMEPIGVHNARQALASGEGATQAALRVAGVNPSPVSESRSNAENKIAGFLAEGMGSRPLTESEYDAAQVRRDLRAQAKKGDFSGVGQALAEGDINPRGAARFVTDARKSLLDRSVNLTPEEFLEVWGAASRSERVKLKLPLVRERLKLLKGPHETRDKLLPLFNAALAEVQ